MGIVFLLPENYQLDQSQHLPRGGSSLSAETALDELRVKGRASKAGYSRDKFGSGWEKVGSCDMRNIILNRDLTDTVIDQDCKVISGILNDPYTGKTINFKRGSSTSDLVQIDHVVALSDAWQKGAQQMTHDTRVRFANDPLELLAVDGKTNNEKAAGDAATWLPPNKTFRCQYVARQVAVKRKYDLWVTPEERVAIKRVLSACPGQQLPKSKMLIP